MRCDFWGKTDVSYPQTKVIETNNPCQGDYFLNLLCKKMVFICWTIKHAVKKETKKTQHTKRLVAHWLVKSVLNKIDFEGDGRNIILLS